MNRQEPVRVVLELEPDGHTISGRIAINDDPGPDFYGWLELIDRLERAKNRGLAPNGEPGHVR